MRKKKKINRHSRVKRAVNSLISGLIINFNDSDPLAREPSKETVKGLPYGHTNAMARPVAHQLFADYREYIFKNDFNWTISVTVINVFGDPMRDPVEVLARGKIAQLTEKAEAYIESVMAEVDMDFYSHVNFSCLLKK